MKKYNVEVIEKLSRVVEIDANSYDEAENIVSDSYDNGEIILDYNDLEYKDYKPYPPQRIKNNFDIRVRYDKNSDELYVYSSNNSKVYNCKNEEDIKNSIAGYINDYIPLEKVQYEYDDKKSKKREFER